MSTSKFEAENIRSIYNQDIASLQKQFLSEDPHDVFHYIYTGEVVDNNDPQKLGRLKIKVINLFDTLTTADIPWANPTQSLHDGSFCIPEKGQFLEVFFDHGDIYSPYYIGHALNKNQIPSHLKDSYPNTILLYQTKQGNFCTINRNTGEFHITCQTGAKITMKVTGEIDIESPFMVDIKAPIVKIEHTASGTVLPDPTGGPFNCLINDPITGMLHQGQIASNT
jgi:hypothetical protein